MSNQVSQQCVICLEPLPNSTGIIDCGHVFCATCIRKWIEEYDYCPLCRNAITVARMYYRSFYMGEEIKVVHHDHEPILYPEFIPDDYEEPNPLDDEFIDDSEIPQFEDENSRRRKRSNRENEGTRWVDGHRTSLRPRNHNELEDELELFKIRREIEMSSVSFMRTVIQTVNEMLTTSRFNGINADELVDKVTQDLLERNVRIVDKSAILASAQNIILQKIINSPKLKPVNHHSMNRSYDSDYDDLEME